MALSQRLRELLPQVDAVREGLACMVPLPVLCLMPARTVEELVCGTPNVPLEALKKVARYRYVRGLWANTRWYSADLRRE